MKKLGSFLILTIFSLSIVSAGDSSGKEISDTIYISTNFGLMKAVFYKDVPNHESMYRDRIKMRAFDGTLFFRIVPDFIIQGGSPDSRNAAPGARVGQGSTQYLLLPEFRKRYFAKKGAIAAPRQPDNINPLKKSDCSQFFIVVGKVYTDGYLDTLEMARNRPIKNAWWKKNYMPHKAEMDSLKKADPRTFKSRLHAYRIKMNKALEENPNSLIFSEEERKALTTVGGTPSIDNEYTFFGEVVEGLDVIDKIAARERDKNERPLKDVVIRSVTIR